MRQSIEFDFETVPLSKSMVLSYEKCPHRFELDFIKKIRMEPSPEMLAGTEFHDSAANVFERMDREKVKDAKSLEDQLLLNMPSTQLTLNFIQIELKRWRRLEDAKRTDVYWPIAIEQFLKDPELNYYGTVDRVDIEIVHGVEHFMVCDYKTGKVPKAANYMTPYLFELAGYRHLVNKSGLLPREVEYWALIYPKETVTLTDHFKSITITAFYKKVRRVRELIKERKFDKKVTPLCGWCPHASTCLADEDVK